MQNCNVWNCLGVKPTLQLAAQMKNLGTFQGTRQSCPLGFAQGTWGAASSWKGQAREEPGSHLMCCSWVCHDIRISASQGLKDLISAQSHGRCWGDGENVGREYQVFIGQGQNQVSITDGPIKPIRRFAAWC